mmetsp:Transcript_19782/g.56605  ORF Transcript_19782/g.56605 Transcript_19782/m.56605 type:complete len:209 (-) Transcript_19782:860-1486(-)
MDERVANAEPKRTQGRRSERRSPPDAQLRPPFYGAVAAPGASRDHGPDGRARLHAQGRQCLHLHSRRGGDHLQRLAANRAGCACLTGLAEKRLWPRTDGAQQPRQRAAVGGGGGRSGGSGARRGRGRERRAHGCGQGGRRRCPRRGHCGRRSRANGRRCDGDASGDHAGGVTPSGQLGGFRLSVASPIFLGPGAAVGGDRQNDVAMAS